MADNLNVLVDPPWVLDAADLPRLERVLLEAAAREVLVKELAPARHAPWNVLLRDLRRDAEVFGGLLVGSPADPGQNARISNLECWNLESTLGASDEH